MVRGTPSPSLPADRAAGFTLIEALCCLFILALVMAAVVPNLTHRPDGIQLELAARQITGLLRLARAQAIGSNGETRVAIDVEHRTVSLPPRPPVRLPAGAGMHLVVARQTIVRGAARGSILFFPDGTSSGGDISLSLGQARGTVRVNWLDGEARFEPMAANAASQAG